VWRAGLESIWAQGVGTTGTVDTPTAESEPQEDRDIHWATPEPETFTRAESTPPPATPSHSATTSPAPTPSLPHDTTNPQQPQQIAAGGSWDTRPTSATNTAHAPSPKPDNKPDPTTQTAAQCGRGHEGRHRTST